jgi:histidyl-tRNA synthetase
MSGPALDKDRGHVLDSSLSIMGKVNTSPLGGTRDFLPLEVLRRKYVVGIVEEVYQSYGFEPLETPVLERIETLLGKYGEEGDQLIFRVMKRGEKLARLLEADPSEDSLADAGLRYDLTVPLARVAAEYESVLPRVFKRYQIQPVFRADRPAKGRFREFFQCDLDIVGSGSRVVEAEVLNASAEVLRRLGFSGPGDFRIRLNHRVVLRALMRVAGVAPAQEETALAAVDKLDKIGWEGVAGELERRRVPSETADRLTRLLSEAPSGNGAILDWLGRTLAEDEDGRRAVEELSRILDYTAEGPAAKYVAVDPYLARGLSYYTGPIFEVEFEGFSGSAGGGGRYDNLIGMFGGREIPACGFSLGLERILLILEERNLFPERLAGQPQVLVTLFGEETVADSIQLACVLRSRGLRVDLFPETAKYGRQFKYSDQRGIRFALLLGPREKELGIVILKDLVSGLQEELSREDCLARLLEKLGEDRGVGSEQPTPGGGG